jgi:hypothetical protein
MEWIKGKIKQSILGILKKYFTGIDDQSLHGGLINGSLNLSGLTFDPEAFKTGTNSPFILNYGHLEDLKIHIPWADIFNAPSLISIKNLTLKVTTKELTDITINREKVLENNMLAFKRMITTKLAEGIDKGQSGKDSWSKQLIKNMATKIILGLTFKLKNINLEIFHERDYTSKLNIS